MPFGIKRAVLKPLIVPGIMHGNGSIFNKCACLSVLFGNKRPRLGDHNRMEQKAKEAQPGMLCFRQMWGFMGLPYKECQMTRLLGCW